MIHSQCKTLFYEKIFLSTQDPTQLTCANVGDRSNRFSPLQFDVVDYVHAIIHVYSIIIVTKQYLTQVVGSVWNFYQGVGVYS